MAGGAVSVIDNTWAAGLFFKPLTRGVDIPFGGTKCLVGHADAMMGVITSTEARNIRNCAPWPICVGSVCGTR